jgi:TPR repeat protein
MAANGMILTAFLVWFCAFELSAQPAEPDRETFRRIKSSADKGDPEAQLQVGMLYGTGSGVTRDPVKAAKWHRKAAEQGLNRAQYQVGLDYEYGQGVKANQVEAVRWFQRAANQGLVEAEYELGACFLTGRGVQESGTEAVVWFRKAAAQGFPMAEFQIGSCYFEGTGVAKNIEEGIRWIQSAAAKGVPTAQNKLGICYQKGEGVPRDYVQAYKWLALAAAQDDQHALEIKISMASLESNLTKEELAEAQRLASEFKPDGKADSHRSSKFITASSAPENSSKTGYVTVKAADERSEIFVDGTFIGNPPAKVKLSEGSHILEVKKSGFKDYRRELKVTSGSDLTLNAELERL